MADRLTHKAKGGYKAARDWLKHNFHTVDNIANVVTVIAFTIGVIALIALVWQYLRPIQLAEIKVPVATDQPNYHPGEEISGIFFGEIYYDGEVRVLREVFCKGYKDIIEPPETARNGDFYDTQSIPRKIEGLSVNIGNLPDDIPVGLNCVLQFTNVYHIQTPFGIRHEMYQYYTQNFSIVTVERRLQLECEATGRKDCDLLTNDQQEAATDQVDSPTTQSSPDSPEPQQPTQNTFIDNPTTTNEAPDQDTQEEAPRLEQQCTFNFLGIRINCRLVPVE